MSTATRPWIRHGNNLATKVLRLPEPDIPRLDCRFAVRVGLVTESVSGGLHEWEVDHGWNLGEHGMWCNHCLYETSVHVPLILRVPWKEPGVHAHAVESLGIYPTLCELCDLPLPGYVMEGTSLAPALDRPEGPVHERTFTRHMNCESIFENGFRYSE